MVVEGLGLLQIIGLSFKKDNTNINYGGMGKINQKKKKKWDDDSEKNMKDLLGFHCKSYEIQTLIHIKKTGISGWFCLCLINFDFWDFFLLLSDSTTYCVFHYSPFCNCWWASERIMWARSFRLMWVLQFFLLGCDGVYGLNVFSRKTLRACFCNWYLCQETKGTKPILWKSQIPARPMRIGETKKN